MEVEPTERPEQVRNRPSRTQKYKPKVGDLVDVKFYVKGTHKKRFSCGTIVEQNRDNDDSFFITFEDGLNEGYYTIGPTGDIQHDEIRQCVEKNGHVRSKEASVSQIQEVSFKEKRNRQRKERRIATRDQEGEVTKVCEAETVITSGKGCDPLSFGATQVTVGNGSLQREDTRTSPDVVLDFNWQEMPMQVRGNPQQVAELMKRLK